ncbi:MAG: exodeoxyribonuclease V subunit alpha, partial [Solirubrobacteraceae bacterium]
LARSEATVAVEDGAGPLRWPAADGWADRVAAEQSLVSRTGSASAPLQLEGTHLYLSHYWLAERELAARLRALAQAPSRALEEGTLADGIARLFTDPEDHLQRVAAACATLRGLTVIAGGPGTGKTTTIARALALIFAHGPAPLVALCAPTGRAAARLQQAVHDQAQTLALEAEVRSQLLALRGQTIHRLLGWRGPAGFRHGQDDRLPHDLLVVDETSMVSLSLMRSLLGAIRSDARVVLVGDPDQLAAVEAGAVLRDIVGPACEEPRLSAGMRAILARVTGGEPPGAPAVAAGFGDGVIALRRGHRFGATIGGLADAIRRGEQEATLAALRGGGREILWIEAEDAGAEPLRDATLDAYRSVFAAASRGDGAGALQALQGFRLLCAHRHGPHGVAHWTAQIERWLAEAIDGLRPTAGHYVGQPLLVTENDYELRLHNGDAGVVVAGCGEEQATAVFERDGALVGLAPSRLGAVQTLYAMSIHKSQGSQFDVTAVVLPRPDSPILTRELLYTAVTRARRRLIVLGGEESLRAAVSRPVARASGLQELLWDEAGAKVLERSS